MLYQPRIQPQPAGRVGQWIEINGQRVHVQTSSTQLSPEAIQSIRDAVAAALRMDEQYRLKDL